MNENRPALKPHETLIKDPGQEGQRIEFLEGPEPPVDSRETVEVRKLITGNPPDNKAAAEQPPIMTVFAEGTVISEEDSVTAATDA